MVFVKKDEIDLSFSGIKKSNWDPSSSTSKYKNPLEGRYASVEMQELFSEDVKFRMWRRLWIALAQSEMELGLNSITQEMIDEMNTFKDDIN
jgi:adenylosuccinate lyase